MEALYTENNKFGYRNLKRTSAIFVSIFDSKVLEWTFNSLAPSNHSQFGYSLGNPCLYHER
jgi:hypothetical protein